MELARLTAERTFLHPGPRLNSWLPRLPRSALQALRFECIRVDADVMSDEEYSELRAPHEDAVRELTDAIKRYDTRLAGNIGQQRRFLTEHLDAIVIAPAKSRGGRIRANVERRLAEEAASIRHGSHSTGRGPSSLLMPTSWPW